MDRTPLPQLDDEALLLAYLADELPAEHRARVERMLADDAGLGETLDALRAAYTDIAAALRSADAAEPLALPASAAARRFGREVRAWQARSAAVELIDEPSRRRFKIPGWAYPVATAAAVILAYSAWWRFAPDRGQYAVQDRQPDSSRMPEGLDYPIVPPTALADRGALDFGAWTWPNALADTDDQENELELAETEAELYALSDPVAFGDDYDDDDDDVPTMRLLDEIE